MFPPDSVEPSLIAPLSHSEFIQRVLVQEAATSLIQEDLDQTKEEAIETLRASAQYGVALFPDDTKDQEGARGANEAEKMMKQRASARRKQLETDNDEQVHVTAASGAESAANAIGADSNDVLVFEPARAKPRKRNDTASTTSGGSDASSSKKPKAKRLKTPVKTSAQSMTAPEADVMELTDSDPNPPLSRRPLVKSSVDNSQNVPVTQSKSRPRPTRSQSRHTVNTDKEEDVENTPSRKNRRRLNRPGDSDSSSDMDLDGLPARETHKFKSKATVIVSVPSAHDGGTVTTPKAKVKSRRKPAPAPFPMADEIPLKRAKPTAIPGQSTR
jgi:hypothetical protein